MRSIYYRLLALLAFLAVACLLIPEWALAAGGKASMLVHVADDRVVQWSFSKFFLHTYNTDPFMFGLLCTLITAVLGGGLGLITDQIMKRTGIDLTSRKLVEH
jgi:hypothetical protein